MGSARVRTIGASGACVSTSSGARGGARGGGGGVVTVDLLLDLVDDASHCGCCSLVLIGKVWKVFVCRE